jgi:hypothetical protein
MSFGERLLYNSNPGRVKAMAEEIKAVLDGHNHAECIMGLCFLLHEFLEDIPPELRVEAFATVVGFIDPDLGDEPS